MLRNPLNQKAQGSNHGEGDYAIGRKSEKPSNVVTAAVVRDHRRDQQNKDDGQQQPTWTQGKRLGQGPVNTGGTQHGYERGPPRFADYFAGHDGEAKSARVEFSTVLLRLKRMREARAGRGRPSGSLQRGLLVVFAASAWFPRESTPRTSSTTS